MGVFCNLKSWSQTHFGQQFVFLTVHVCTDSPVEAVAQFRSDWSASLVETLQVIHVSVHISTLPDAVE